MKRIYSSIVIVAALLAIAFYSSSRVQSFAREISAELETAVEAVRADDTETAREAVLTGAESCGRLRGQMSAFIRTEDLTELEAALRAADGYLELGSLEEAFGELRRAQTETENLKRLADRLI